VEIGSLLLNFIVMDMELREKQNTAKKKTIYTRNVSCSRFMLDVANISALAVIFRSVRKIAKSDY
jgi:hypothetical protein